PPPGGRHRDPQLVRDLAIGAAFEVGEADHALLFGLQLRETASDRVPLQRRGEALPPAGVAVLWLVHDQHSAGTSVAAEPTAGVNLAVAADQPGAHRVEPWLAIRLRDDRRQRNRAHRTSQADIGHNEPTPQ